MGIPILGDLIGGIFDQVGNVASELIVDKDKKVQLQYNLERLRAELTDKAEQRVHDEMVAQVEVNKAEASHRSIFVAGWRPAVGWVGVFALSYSFIIAPFLEFALQMRGPELQTESILFLLSGMLGFGGLRTWEKIKGVVPQETSDLGGSQPRTSQKRLPIDLVPEVLKRTPPEDAPW